jgi:putative membrane protein
VSVPDDDVPDRRWPRRVYAVGSEPDPRFSFANERTFLAWIRTGLGFVTAGVAVAAVANLNHALGLEVRVAALVLVLCGLVCGVAAMTQWMGNERAIRLSRALPSSPVMPFLTGAIVLVALTAIVVVSLQ